VASEGKLPLDPTGMPNLKHLDSVTAAQRYGFLPVENMQEEKEGLFLQTPNFLDAMLKMADFLFTVPREQRTNELRRHLEKLELEFLPSNSIYMPVNNVHHRVWRIVADESIAISTKERVPCIVCLEVVGYNPVPAITKGTHGKLGFLEMIRQESSDSTPPSPGAISPMSNLLKQSTADEREQLSRWSKNPRNPRRHLTLLDNLNNFTRDTVRMTSETVRKLREHHGSQEMIFTRLPSTIDDQSNEEDEELGSLMNNSVSLDPIVPPSTPTREDVLSPTTAIGQWASPTSPQNIVSQRRKEHIEPDGDKTTNDIEIANTLVDIRHKNEKIKAEKVYGSSGENGKSKPIRPPPVVFKESWESKQARIREKSCYGKDPSWKLFPILIKSNDDLRQEQLASQLIYRMASILAHEKIPVWLCPYEIVALTDRGGIIEAIPDTISLDSLKRNDENYSSLRRFFRDHFGQDDEYLDAKANFVESLAAYSIVCFLLQIKDRHNGNILLDNRGHLIHIDFGFFFLSSPGKNSGFESAPFKLTREFVQLLDGPESKTFRTFRDLCCRTFLTLRKHCHEITLLVEMLCNGNEDLNCFRGRPNDAVRGLKERFRLDLNDRACIDYVNALVDESLENWRTRWYDRYQRFCVGVL